MIRSSARGSTLRGLLLTFAVPFVRVLALGAISALAGLSLWAVVPVLTGWSGHVVVSGSMSPNVQVGDVLLSQSVRPERLRPGMVLVFRRPGSDGEVFAHRLQGKDATGELITKGDANSVSDTTRVPTSDVLGVARLRVPVVGLPALWLRRGDAAALAVLLIGSTGAVLLASGRRTDRVVAASDSTGAGF